MLLIYIESPSLVESWAMVSSVVIIIVNVVVAVVIVVVIVTIVVSIAVGGVVVTFIARL